MTATPADALALAQQFDRLWASGQTPGVLLQRIRVLAQTYKHLDPALAAFELASAFDYAGHEQQAERHYREYLTIDDPDVVRRRRAVIQLASTLRLLGRSEESAAALEELLRGPRTEHTQAATAFLALSLRDAGRSDAALAVVLRELCRPLDEYQRSLNGYIDDLEPTGDRRPG